MIAGWPGPCRSESPDDRVLPSKGDCLSPHAFANIGLQRRRGHKIDPKSRDCGKPFLQREEGRKRDWPIKLHQDIKVVIGLRVIEDS